MTGGKFVSYSQNGEDVVLWRALGNLENGRYVDVGAMHPTDDSVTKVFYDAGWRGLSVEPVPANAKRFAIERPDDEVIEAVIAAESGLTTRLYNVVDTGLSTVVASLATAYGEEGHEVEELDVPTLTLADAVAASRIASKEVHFLKIDVEGAEVEVLAGIDLTAWRPWVLVIEATLPNSTKTVHDAWEPQVLASGYRFCMFDGLNRFYVAEEHAADLAPALSIPASVADGFVARRDQKALLEARHQVAQLRHQLAKAEQAAQPAAAPDVSMVDSLWKDVIYWRSAAVEAWADAAAAPHRELEEIRFDLQEELAKVKTYSQKKQQRLHQRKQEMEVLRRDLRIARRRLREVEAELDSVRASLSWRVTKPIRSVRRAQRRVIGRDA